MSQFEEREVLELAERLRRERPVPSAAFRGELRRRLVAQPAPERPERLWARVGALAGSGAALLALAALGAVGAGPLGV